MDGQRFVINGGLALACAGVVFSSLFVWFLAGLTFFGEPLHQVDYLHMALAFGMAAALLVAAVPAGAGLRPRSWLVPLELTLAVLCGIGALAALLTMSGADRGDSGEPWWWAPQVFFVLPSTWPILGLIAATPWIRGWWSPRRRAPQGR